MIMFNIYGFRYNRYGEHHTLLQSVNEKLSRISYIYHPIWEEFSPV